MNICTQIESNTEVTIRFEISNIRTALNLFPYYVVLLLINVSCCYYLSYDVVITSTTVLSRWRMSNAVVLLWLIASDEVC